jgi:hypothetical protein
MPKTHVNEHRWKKSLDVRIVGVLEEAAEQLRISWKFDGEYPNSYPLNTDHVLSETMARLTNEARVAHSLNVLRKSRVPVKSLYDLIDESTVRRLYEQQHSGGYSQALRQASEGYGSGLAAWKRIVACLVPGYLLAFEGTDGIPKPRVHFLHRSLLEIAKSLELNHLTKEGMGEFLDDVCPCGKKHNAEAIRKLRKRVTKSQEAYCRLCAGLDPWFDGSTRSQRNKASSS